MTGALSVLLATEIPNTRDDQNMFIYFSDFLYMLMLLFFENKTGRVHAGECKTCGIKQQNDNMEGPGSATIK